MATELTGDPLMDMMQAAMNAKDDEIKRLRTEIQRLEFLAGAPQRRAEQAAKRYAELPEDVQKLQEEVAAWKDEYATQKQRLNVSMSMRQEMIDERNMLERKLRKARKKLRVANRLLELIMRGGSK